MPNQSCSNGNLPLKADSDSHNASPRDRATADDQQSDTLFHDPSQASTIPPQSLPSTLFDRLNAQVEQELRGAEPESQRDLLTEIGSEVRKWRIRCGYSRQTLATKLDCNVVELLSLENGLSASSDFPPVDKSSNRLATGNNTVSVRVVLIALVNHAALDIPLRTRIQKYLDRLPSHDCTGC